MEAEQGAESPVLEPADEKLPVFRVVRVALEEPADVGRPPWNTAHRHIEPCPHLHPE